MRLDWVRVAGLGLGLLSSAAGVYGLINAEATRPLARLGALSSVDRNRDGRISRSEWGQAEIRSPSFDKLDLNHDGYLDAKEAKRWHPTRGGE